MSYLTDFQNFARQLNLNPTMSGYTQQLPQQQLQAGDPNYWQSMADMLRPYTQANEQNVLDTMPGVERSSVTDYAGQQLNKILAQRNSKASQTIGSDWQGILGRTNGTAIKDNYIATPYLKQMFGEGLLSQLQPYLNQSKTQSQINWDSVMNAADPAAALTQATRSAYLRTGLNAPNVDGSGRVNWATNSMMNSGLWNQEDIQNRFNQAKTLGDPYSDPNFAKYRNLGSDEAALNAYMQDMQMSRPVDATGAQMQSIGEGSQYLNPVQQPTTPQWLKGDVTPAGTRLTRDLSTFSPYVQNRLMNGRPQVQQPQPVQQRQPLQNLQMPTYNGNQLFSQYKQNRGLLG